MAKIQDIDLPHLEFAEGSAPATPAAAIVRLYAKSDGLLYSKDDAGTETVVSGGGAAGAEVGATLQKIARTSGDLTLAANTTTHTEVSSAMRLTLACATGDVILAGIVGVVQAGSAGECAIDVATIVSSAIVNRFNGGGTRVGIGYAPTSGFGSINGSAAYAAQSGDISGGNIVVSPSFYQGGAGAGTLKAAGSYALLFWAVNLKH